MIFLKSIQKDLLLFVLLVQIMGIYSQECGWAYRIERFLLEHDAMEGSWPWMVAIVRKRQMEDDINHRCSGSMITTRHVLTVAHCFALNKNPYIYKARIGHIEQRLASEYDISRIVVHDSYVHGLYYNDIAVLTLERNVEFENFNPICLPSSTGFVNLISELTALVGWGRITSSWKRSPNLREQLGLAVISNSRCNEKLSQNVFNFNKSFPNGVTDEIICTDNPNECIVDSGSPLMYQEEDQWYIVGLVSFKMSCEKPGFSTGYTKVSNYLKWIEKNTNLDCGVSPRLYDSKKDGEAPLESWPWMVAILTTNTRNRTFLRCSGSIITRRHVLAPAQCFMENPHSTYKARIGNIEWKKGKKFNITRVVVPPSYKYEKFYDDIAIATLENDIDFEAFSPICLFPSHDFVNLTGQFTALAGWELPEKSNSSVVNLKEKFGLVVISNSRCHEKFNKTSNFKRLFPRGIVDEMICTTYPGKCNENSGSLLMYQKEDRWYAVGMVAFGYECEGRHGAPTGYIRVSEYIKWIAMNTASY